VNIFKGWPAAIFSEKWWERAKGTGVKWEYCPSRKGTVRPVSKIQSQKSLEN